MKDEINHEVEETEIKNFLQVSLEDDEYYYPENMNTIDCNHIRIGTFITENEESLPLCADTGAPRSVIGKKQMKRTLDKFDLRSMPAIRSNRIFRFGDV